MLLEPVVEVELALVPQLHDRDGREGLRDRADPVLRAGCRLRRGLVVGGADGVRPDGLACAHDRCGERGQALGLPTPQDALEALLEVAHQAAARTSRAAGTTSIARSMSPSLRSRCVTARRMP